MGRVCGVCVCVCVCVCRAGGWRGIWRAVSSLHPSGSHQWEGLIHRVAGPGPVTGQPCMNDFTVLVPRLFSCFKVRERPTRRLGGYLTQCN